MEKPGWNCVVSGQPRREVSRVSHCPLRVPGEVVAGGEGVQEQMLQEGEDSADRGARTKVQVMPGGPLLTG